MQSLSTPRLPPAVQVDAYGEMYHYGRGDGG